MPIKQSLLEKKWYYRVAKVLFLLLPSLLAVLVIIYNIQQKDFNRILEVVIALGVYLLILKCIWRIFLYIVFGGLENDVKRGGVRAAQPTDRPVAQSAAAPRSGGVSEEDKKQIGFYLGLLIIIGIIYYMYFIWKPNNPLPQWGNQGGSNSSGCIPTGCGSSWRCDGTYFDANGTKRSLHACLPRKAGETYSGWSGTCRKCP